MSNIQKIADSFGAALLPDNKTHTNRMEIPSASSDRLYIVAQAMSSGEWQCSCPGWIMKKGRERGCKHLKAMLPALTAIEESKPKAIGTRSSENLEEKKTARVQSEEKKTKKKVAKAAKKKVAKAETQKAMEYTIELTIVCPGNFKLHSMSQMQSPGPIQYLGDYDESSSHDPFVKKAKIVSKKKTVIE